MDAATMGRIRAAESAMDDYLLKYRVLLRASDEARARGIRSIALEPTVIRAHDCYLRAKRFALELIADVPPTIQEIYRPTLFAEAVTIDGGMGDGPREASS